MFLLISLPHTPKSERAAHCSPSSLSSFMETHDFTSQPAMRTVSWQPKVPPPAVRAGLRLAAN